MAEKARPTFISIARQLESLTPKTRRAERGFRYEMRKLRMIVRTELQIARGEVGRRARILQALLADSARRVRQSGSLR